MRFAKPFTVTVASAALIALPFAGSALADGARPRPAATAKAPQPTHSFHAKDAKDAKRRTASLQVAVSSSRVRAGSSYAVTITTKGLSSGTATLTTPEGRTYRVPLSSGRARKNLTVPSRMRAGTKTVKVKVAGKTATASFTVTAASKRHPSR